MGKSALGPLQFIPYVEEMDAACDVYKGYVTAGICALAGLAIYRNPRNLMVFCSGTGAMIGSLAACCRDAHVSTILSSTGVGATLGAVFAKFLPEQMSKVHQYVIGFFGVQFADSASTSSVGSDVSATEPVVQNETETPVNETQVDGSVVRNETEISVPLDTDGTASKLGDVRGDDFYDLLEEEADA